MKKPKRTPRSKSGINFKIRRNRLERFLRLRLEQLEDRRVLAAGDLDLAFGSSGLVTTDLASTTVGLQDAARAVAVQQDGRIVVAGVARRGGGSDFGVVRYDSNGDLDPTFDSDGKVTTEFGSADEAYDVVIDRMGKIIVVGNTGDDFAIARYEPNGSLDTTFGAGGRVTTSFGDADGAVGVALDSHDRIIVVGFSTQGGTNGLDLAVARYLANGTLDPSFGSGGKVLTHISDTEALLDVAIDAQDRVVAGGYSKRAGGTDFDFTLVRYTESGILDAELDDDGIQTTSFNAAFPANDVARSIALDAAGRIILTGDASMTSIDFAAARYLDNGELDTSFSGDGRVTASFGSGSDRGYYGSAVDAAGNILMAGYVDGFAENWNFGLARITSEGILDSSFGSGGLVQTDFGLDFPDFGLDMALQPDGKIVVVGESFQSGNTSYDFAVARYHNQLPISRMSGTKWNDVNGNGIRETGEPSLSGWTIFLDQNQNRVLDAGEQFTITGADGTYAFNNLAAGEYYLAEVPPAGWEPTFPGLTLADGVKIFVSGGTDIITHDGGQIVRMGFDGSNYTVLHNDTLAPIGVDDITQQIFFRLSDNPGVSLRADYDLVNPATVLTNWGPNTYEIDFPNNRFFFPIGRELYKASFSNPQPEEIMPGLNSISDIEYDPVTDSVFTANTNALTTGDNIWSFSADGSTWTQLIGGLDDVQGIAVDRVNRRMYFSDGPGFVRSIYTANLDGSDVRLLIDTSIFGLSRPTDIEVIPELNAIFWIDQQLRGVYRANLNGSGSQRIADLPFEPKQLEVSAPFYKVTVASGQSATADLGSRRLLMDFGDAPDSTQSGFISSYPTSLSQNGARHIAIGPTLGPNRDAESDGTPSLGADGDDLVGPTNDEDGTAFSGPIITSTQSAGTATVQVELQNADTTANYLTAWIDWNRDGDWRDAGEQIFDDLDLGTINGVQQLAFTVPQDTGSNVVEGETYARFRVSSAAGLSWNGAAIDGEVEDVRVSVSSAASTDIRMQSLTTDGSTSLAVTYEIIGGPVSAFDIDIVRSANNTYGSDVLLDSLNITAPADLTTGVHTKSFVIGGGAGEVNLPGAGAAEFDDDYYILAVADPDDVIFEADAHFANEDNTTALFGVYHQVGGTVMVHGSDEADSITIGTVSLQINVNGDVFTYNPKQVAGFRIRAHGGADVVDGTIIKETFWLAGGPGNDILRGGPLADVLIGGAGDDELQGQVGNDTYVFDADEQSGTDTLNDSRGTDTLDFSSTSSVAVAVDLGTTATQVVNGNLKIVLASATIFENVTGGAGDDILRGSTRNNILVGGPGDDQLIGLKGNDTYRWDADSPQGSDTVDEAGGGKDILDFSSSSQAIAVNLSLTTTQTVNANLQLTLLQGDTLDNVNGGRGDDQITGNRLANVLSGSAGDDTLAGQDGNDRFVFDADSQLGSDDVIEQPGDGTDTLDFSSTTSVGVNLDLALTGWQVVNPRLQLRLSSSSTMEGINGGRQDDILRGNSLANTLNGNQGNDVLEGFGGDDILQGQAGDDLLIGGANDDHYVFDTDSNLNTDIIDESAAAGGGGRDVLDFALTTKRDVTVDLSLSALQVVNANLSLQLVAGSFIEDAVGGARNDTLFGNDLDNVLDGGRGDDVLEGRSGDDRYVFDADLALGTDTVGDKEGNDTLDYSLTSKVAVIVDLGTGAAQNVAANHVLLLGSSPIENAIGGVRNDQLTGSSANNVLIGGRGNDQLVGGGGRDLLVGGSHADSLLGGVGDDVLIGGRVTYFNESNLVFQHSAFKAIMDEWTRTDLGYEDRVAHLLNGDGLNAPSRLDSSTVQSDSSAVDQLFGEGDRDWFLVASEDDTVDDEVLEIITVI